jgi:hypothetical protein
MELNLAWLGLLFKGLLYWTLGWGILLLEFEFWSFTEARLTLIGLFDVTDRFDKEEFLWWFNDSFLSSLGLLPVVESLINFSTFENCWCSVLFIAEFLDGFRAKVLVGLLCSIDKDFGGNLLTLGCLG